MFYGCVTSKGVGALIPTSETTDTRKYIEILEKYLRPYVSRYHAIAIQHDTTPDPEENDIFTMEWSA